LFNLTSSIVCGVSFDDQEIGFQTRHSVPTVPIVLEQLATSNPLASTSVSFDSVLQPAKVFISLLRSYLSRHLALREPHDAREDASHSSESADDEEELHHFATFLAA
jgi:hypothetical protein